MSQFENDLIEVGHIIGVHGVRGQIRVFSLTSPRENIVTYSPWIVDHAGIQITSKVKGKRQGKHVVADLDCIQNRDQAEEYINAKILISRQQLPDLDQGDYYWSQLTGLRVVNAEGIELGCIDHMIETGANDVMVVQGGRERLIPYAMNDVVKSIDLEQQQILVDWQEDF